MSASPAHPPPVPYRYKSWAEAVSGEGFLFVLLEWLFSILSIFSPMSWSYIIFRRGPSSMRDRRDRAHEKTDVIQKDAYRLSWFLWIGVMLPIILPWCDKSPSSPFLPTDSPCWRFLGIACLVVAISSGTGLAAWAFKKRKKRYEAFQRRDILRKERKSGDEFLPGCWHVTCQVAGTGFSCLMLSILVVAAISLLNSSCSGLGYCLLGGYVVIAAVQHHVNVLLL